MSNYRNTELQGILDEFEHECFMLRVEASETRARDDVARKSYERIRDEFAERIAATLVSDRESELQSALNKAAGNWAKADARLRESYRKVPEQGKYGNEGERESYGEVCGDDRFELIAKAKRKLLECTNIESRPEEVAVLDSILFRCWQMGWLDQLRDAGTRWHQLFGTPERAARTVGDYCYNAVSCAECGIDCEGRFKDSDALLEWLRGESE